MGPFIGYWGNWKMVELLGLERRFCKVNQGKHLCMTLYLYKDPAYCTVYNIMGSYKNYLNRLRIAVYNQFNKAIAKLHI